MLNVLLYGGLAVGIVVLILLLLNRKAVSRVWEAMGAQVGKGGKAVWGSDPEAIFEQRTEAAAEELKGAVSGLEQYQTLMTGMQRMVDGQQQEKRVLEGRIKAHLAAGRRDEAGADALKLKAIEAKLAANSGKLADYQEAYKAGLKKVKNAKDKIVALRQRGKELGAELKMSKAEAALTDAACKINVNGPNLDGIGEVEDELLGQIAANRAKSQVARDLGTDGLAEIEAEEQIAREQAEDVLKEFEAKMQKPQA